MQHIEEAGIHSGDSACVIPPHSLPADIIDEIKRQTRAGPALNVKGLMNIQFAVAGLHGPDRSGAAPEHLTSSKPTRAPAGRCRSSPRRPACRWPGTAALVMVGKTLDELGLADEVVPTHYSVKESVFPFNKFPGVDIILGPEMRSTGEVMGIDDSFPMAFAKCQMAATAPLPRSGTVFISVADRDKPEFVPIARQLAEMGYHLIATRGTAGVLRAAGVTVEEVPKIQEGRPT